MSEHVNCGGNLTFSHTDKKGKIMKQMHKCDKCGALVNVIVMPSYEQYVLMGAIKVSQAEYNSISDRYARMKE